MGKGSLPQRGPRGCCHRAVARGRGRGQGEGVQKLNDTKLLPHALHSISHGSHGSRPQAGRCPHLRAGTALLGESQGHRGSTLARLGEDANHELTLQVGPCSSTARLMPSTHVVPLLCLGPWLYLYRDRSAMHGLTMHLEAGQLKAFPTECSHIRPGRRSKEESKISTKQRSEAELSVESGR